MAATVSLSKGVFAFRKNKSRAQKDNLEYWRKEDGKNSSYIQEKTLNNYKKCWKSISGLIEELFEETHTKVLEDLVNYVKQVGQTMCEAIFHDTSVIVKDIPAACLVTGVNMPDHGTIFNSLSKLLNDSVSPYITRLSTNDCSNLKMAVHKIVSSLINNEESIMFESDSEDEIFTKTSKSKGIKRADCNMATLSAWYKEQMVSKSDEREMLSPLAIFSPKKKAKYSTKNERKKSMESPSKTPSKRPTGLNMSVDENTDCKKPQGSQPIVIIVENVESISMRFLQDLILLISVYRTRLPVVLVFGVSTTPSYLHRHMTQEASSCVAMETFQSQPSSLLLSELIEKVLMTSRIPFHVGGKVFKLLLDIFLFHDLSVNNFIAGLKFCVLEHFLRGNASVLCCSKSDRKAILQERNPDMVASLRGLPSFKKLQETLSEDEKNKLEDDAYFCTRVRVYLSEFQSGYSYFCALTEVLHCLVQSLPGSPLGRQVREVFSLCLSQQVTDSEEFQSAWKLLSLSAAEEIIPKIEQSISILKSCDDIPDADLLKQKLMAFSERLSKISEVTQEETTTKKTPFVVDLKPSDRFHLREKLLGAAKAKSAKNPFEELRTEILNCFEHVFISHLKPVSSKPFHEVFLFDALGSVKYQLLGSHRATITTGLSNPQKYLQCDCCKLEGTDCFVTSLPDLSICYKLHLECGRLINLYDWLQAFLTVLGEADDSDSKSKRKKKESVNDVLQARFIQAVSELQFLGFIKSTKRKTDHVQRLTWGTC